MKSLKFNNTQGFSLTEVLISTGIAMFLMTIIMGMLVLETRSSASFQKSSEGWLESNTARTALNISLRNVIRIHPEEDLANKKDETYFGMTDLRANLAPDECLADQNYSVLRMTSLGQRFRPEKVLRPWDEDSAGKTGPGHELRITHDEERSAFASNQPPEELLIIDMDGQNRRRYSVFKFEVRTTPLDPYDDEPKTDADGIPISFTYTAVTLRQPRKVKGGFISPMEGEEKKNFVTNSLVYPSETTITCVSKAQKNLINYNETTKKVTNLTNRGSTELGITRFSVEFASSKKTQSVDDLEFFTNLTDNDMRSCVNIIRFGMEMKDLSVTQKDNEPPPVWFSRDILLPNLATGRAIICEE